MRALRVGSHVVGRVVGRADEHEEPRLLGGGEPGARGLVGVGAGVGVRDRVRVNVRLRVGVRVRVRVRVRVP